MVMEIVQSRFILYSVAVVPQSMLVLAAYSGPVSIPVLAYFLRVLVYLENCRPSLTFFSPLKSK